VNINSVENPDLNSTFSIIIYNSPPFLNYELEPLRAKIKSYFIYTFPADLFSDDENDRLVYTLDNS